MESPKSELNMSNFTVRGVQLSAKFLVKASQGYAKLEQFEIAHVLGECARVLLEQEAIRQADTAARN